MILFQRQVNPNPSKALAGRLGHEYAGGCSEKRFAPGAIGCAGAGVIDTGCLRFGADERRADGSCACMWARVGYPIKLYTLRFARKY